MKEHPIPFRSEMVLAILDGKKTQTRRLIKPEWSRCLDLEDPGDVQKAIRQCPYGQVGDRLWVKESWDEGCMGSFLYKANYSLEELSQGKHVFHWKSSRFMPKIASRIYLELLKIRLEKLQQMYFRRDDAFAEGISPINPYKLDPNLPPGMPAAFPDYSNPKNCFFGDPVPSFRTLWDSINARQGFCWDSDPWVWVIEFRKVAG